MLGIVYPIEQNTVDTQKLVEQLAVVNLPSPKNISIEDNGNSLFLQFSEELSTEQRTILDEIVSSCDPNFLNLLKEKRIEEIDQKTAYLIEEGFEFNGVTFSGSIHSQSRLVGAFLAKNDISYPICWLSKDNNTSLNIIDASMLTDFFNTGFGTLKAKIDLGSNLKLAINEATTIEMVNEIVDPR